MRSHQERFAPASHKNLHPKKKEALAKSRKKVVAGSDTDSDANVSTLALNPPSSDESKSTTVAAPMEVHRRKWLCFNLFRPPYVCGQFHKTVHLWCMHCEGCGFCLHTLECPVRGRAHPNTDKWLFQKWCQEVDVEEVLTATLPNEPVSGGEGLDVLSTPLLASPPGKEVKTKEVQSSDSEVDLFAPPPTALVPQKKVNGKKALPSAPPPPKVKGKKALPSAPPIDPPTSKRRTRSTIPSETTPLGVGDWLTDKDILCWLNQEVCHMEIDEPRPSACRELNGAQHWITWLGAVAAFLWLIPMTRKGCTGLCTCVPSIVVFSWSFSLFGFRNP